MKAPSLRKKEKTTLASKPLLLNEVLFPRKPVAGRNKSIPAPPAILAEGYPHI